ncbi:hypothetical protein E2C01_087665 [Portunus trituberculatus]|uniref:Uncharacterized protein n=1 Tax=Portunus trituberculatus TaxID=210409 RepID=A0A5B7J771_PORTR|nr:hypothetical protein [Portunus trituberculatus]
MEMMMMMMMKAKQRKENEDNSNKIFQQGHFIRKLMPIDCTRVIKADMQACGQSLARVEEKAPPISTNNCRGSGTKVRHYGHELTPLRQSYPAALTLYCYE